MAAGHIGARFRLPQATVLPGMGRWAATLAATVISTYALDFIATAAGLALLGSQLLSGWPQGWVLLFLLGSYLAWGAGLYANLKANWDLLQRTGASTNVLSKAAHDIAARLTPKPRWRRIAADAGYVGTELAKETPYYAGAFGAALFSDAIDAIEAVIFLGGANLGAAVYEVALAHGSRLFLRFRAARYASFETEWRPQAYLAEYYAQVEPDEQRTIRFLVEEFRKLAPGQRVLVFGVGPTLHHVFLAAEKAAEIHLAEFLPANLREIDRWLARDPRAHDWRPFVRYTLQCEGIAIPSEAQIAAREDLARCKITRLLHADLRQSDALGTATFYPVVISAYCADSATGDRGEWHAFMQRIVKLVCPGGMVLTAALRRTRGYRVGGKLFPSADLVEQDLRQALVLQCSREGLTVEGVDFGAVNAKGYRGILLARARKLEAATRPRLPELPC